MGETPDPPFEITYKNLFDKSQETFPEFSTVEEHELPLIDMKKLCLEDTEKQACKKLIAQASREWGFFQVINHGISREVIERMREEQVKLFKKPFHEKDTYKGLSLKSGSYRWGTRSATCVNQLSWSEAFHVKLSDVFGCSDGDSLSSSMEQFAIKVSKLAQQLANILAEEMSHVVTEASFFKEKCPPESCYLRLNRYPVCPIVYIKKQVMGITAHTDSDFLTVLHQDKVGGLQLVKDGRWIAVKPNPEALIINIGDLFQAWSNNVYKSVEHRVVTNAINERFSIAYFFCPSQDTVIHSKVYKSFSFGEYKKQVEEDVKIFGHKVGLSRFLVSTH